MSEVLSKISCDHIPEGDSCGLVVTLIEQNAKLRELVRDLWMQLLNAYDRKEVDEFAYRMRELRVEVDG